MKRLIAYLFAFLSWAALPVLAADFPEPSKHASLLPVRAANAREAVVRIAAILNSERGYHR